MKIFHIFHYSTFTIPYINFLHENFNSDDHFFAIYNPNETEFTLPKVKNIWEGQKPRHLLKLIKKMNSSDKLIFHSLIKHKFVQLLFLQPWLTKKTYWVMWGVDLRYSDMAQKNFYFYFYEFVRKRVIKNIGYIITHTPGDYTIAKERYKTKAELKECFYYPTAIAQYLFKDSSNNKKHVGLNIILGNSASSTNNHEEIILRLSKLENKEFKLYCPLSYGDIDNARKVENYGKRLLKNRFIVLSEFMDLKEYFRFLSSMDIAIFNFDRQQALGNILSLFYLGKKVFLKENTTLTEMLDSKGIIYFSNNSIENELFNSIDETSINHNRESITKNFSKEKSIQDWDLIFNE